MLRPRDNHADDDSVLQHLDLLLELGLQRLDELVVFSQADLIDDLGRLILRDEGVSALAPRAFRP